MKRDSYANTETAKGNPSPEVTCNPAAQWDKHGKRTESPAPPPVWTRYIDSRLKQFCTR